MALPRNDSSSVISSLQMDYGDSDEEESDVKQNSFSKSSAEGSAVIEQLKTNSTQNSSTASPTDSVNSNKNVGDTQSTLEAMEVSSIDYTKEEKEERSPVDDISDDDEHDSQMSSDRQHKSQHERHGKDEKLQHIKDTEMFSEAVNVDSPASQGSTSTKISKKGPSLVSYANDEEVGSDEDSDQEDGDSNVDSPALNATDASILSRSVQNMSKDEIQIPPEPPGKCPYSLQRMIEQEYKKMKQAGVDHNRIMQEKKNFRNPSIYEKLIDFCHIDENGTNFPPEIYNPHVWGKESFYDELDKAQRKDMEKREKDKKERTKIDFMTGVKKSLQADNSQGMPDEKKRKTKWDAQPTNIQVQFTKPPSAQQNPGVVNLTATATGTKGKVISAVGTLSKKPSK